MKVSRTMAYALEAALQLARAAGDEPVSCRLLAGAGGMPKRFLLQILRVLVTRGLVHSKRGVIGGYTLARKPAQISLLDLVEAIEGPVVSDVSTSPFADDDGHKQFRMLCDDIAADARARLASVSLADLMSSAPLPAPASGTTRMPRESFSPPAHRAPLLGMPPSTTTSHELDR